MLNEGRGISNYNKEYIDRIYSLFIYNGYNKEIFFRDSKRNITISIFFRESGNSFASLEESPDQYIMVLSCPKIYTEQRVKEEIAHELNHITEIYETIKKDVNPRHNRVQKALRRFSAKETVNIFFKRLIYKTLDNEINANIARMYSYLIMSGAKEESELLRKLRDSDVWKEYNNLYNLSASQRIISDIRKSTEAIRELKQLNQSLIDHGAGEKWSFIRYDLDKDLDKYIESWFKIVKKKSKKFLDRSERIVKEVVSDYTLPLEEQYKARWISYYSITEDSILNENDSVLIMKYREYLLSNIKEEEG